ncbi:cyclase family protein [Candidatus Uhrbacteria bacterium]|nr:MAG: cyclase family protein [Candidatus Uhrbacteria bacterium]
MYINRHIVDLTYEMYAGMPTFNAPWHTKIEIEQMGTIETVGRETRKLTIGTHTGTQIDAPLHFIPNGMPIHRVPLDRMFGRVQIMDCSDLGENEELAIDRIAGNIKEKKVLFRFGWSKYWETDKFYNGYPFISEAAAKYLVDLNVDLVGFDTPSPDDSRTVLRGDILGSHRDSPIHKILLGAGIPLLEYLANLDSVTDLEGWALAAVPLKIRGADGSPARAFLFRPEEL